MSIHLRYYRSDGTEEVLMQKTEFIRISVKADEKAAFQEAAQLAGIPLSAWIRERLRWDATRELERADRSVAFLERRAEEIAPKVSIFAA